MSTASSGHAESFPQVRAARADCAAIAARRDELQAEFNRLHQLLRSFKTGEAVQEEPGDTLARILGGGGLSALALQKADVSARYSEVLRDLRALEQFGHKADNNVFAAYREVAAQRVRGADFVAAAQAIGEAADQLERANAAMRDLVTTVAATEGHHSLDLLSSSYMGLTIGLQDVSDWRAGVERLCGAQFVAAVKVAEHV